MPSFINSVVVECRIEYADAFIIFSSLNSFVSCILMSFVGLGLLKLIYHNKESVSFGSCFYNLSIHSYIASFRHVFLLSVSCTSYVSIAFASFGANLGDARFSGFEHQRTSVIFQQFHLFEIVALDNALLIRFEVVEDARFSLCIRNSIVARHDLYGLADATELFYLQVSHNVCDMSRRKVTTLLSGSF
ncbi:MAG: hypothetical protein EZS28_005400 [Streblomastix strix]|uniref:Uncharacterized protein n=1 Tax=Streblomastix strix TaxID=222440 RepID=A0A5J4WVN3_9EUKA|nr:MAG: hypothetical protein EZS28_005400 [Streblomastix strix]